MLEKILEEIEIKKKKCLDIVKIEVDPMEITIHREQYKGLRMAEDIIHKNMNDGWILKLPCNVGDTVWDNDFGHPCAYEVTGFSFGNLNEDCCDEDVTVFDRILIYYSNSSGSITGRFAISEIGKTIFLTKEAAEVVLKEMNND